MRRTLILVVLAIAAPARAGDFWSSAAEDGDDDTARKSYDREMQIGDSFALLASERASAANEQKRMLLQAIKAYENAALARPDAAEPHYRAGLVLRNFFVECGPTFAWCQHGHASPPLAAKMADEWTAFETLAPLDPRVDFDFLFSRAIAHTYAAGDGVPDKVAEEHIEAALADYRAALTRTALDRANLPNVYGNMAETLMMLGRLDDAIAEYEDTLRNGADTSTMYGLAVALDRDEQGAKAREIIRALGTQEFDAFKEKIRKGEAFFVPSGEIFYYLALAEEAFGDDDQAIDDWQHFIDSGAHARFDERAAANRDALVKRGHKHGRARPAPTPPPDEP